MEISPAVMISSPAIIARRVDFPQPDGPTSTTNSPASTSRLMPLSTSTAPKLLLTFLTLSDAMMVLLDCPLGQPADEVAAAEEVDEEGRKCADQHGSAHHVVVAHGSAVGGERNQRRGDRLLAAGA